MAAGGQLKVYFDLLSQPSRAIVLFLKLNKIPHVACPVALRKGAHLTEEFARNVSPFQKVPVVHDGEFRLTESVAILRHLCRTRGDLIADHWYPSDPLVRARVDEYLEWQHANTRFNCAMYFQKKVN
jgi:glutathione S-transferase